MINIIQDCCRRYAMGLTFCEDCPAALPKEKSMILNDDTTDLLKWLLKEDYSQYGECHGKALDTLIEHGLVQVHGPGEHQSGFIAQDRAGNKGPMFRAVSLTDRGKRIAKELI